MRNVIQLLILVLIGLMCGGIFTTAIVSVRDAADRSRCYNNLKQLAMAVQNYGDTYSKFPSATEENSDLPPEKRLSWIVAIVPFVEAGNLYNKIDHKKGWDSEENRWAALFDVLYLHCPSHPEGLSDSAFFPTNYLGISGIGERAIHLSRDDPRAGFYGYDRPVTLEEMKRGTAETLVIVETSRVHSAWTAAGSATARGLIPDGSPYISAGGQFGGNHRKGANVAFADGSIRFVESSIDPAVWEAMATLSGKGNWE